DGGWHPLELTAVLEAVIRPLLLEQEQSLTRSLSAMLDSYRAAQNPLVGLDVSEPRPAALRPRPQGSCTPFDEFERQFSGPPDFRGGGLDRQVSDSSRTSWPKSLINQRGNGPTVKSLEDARGMEILSSMAKQGRLGTPGGGGDRVGDSAAIEEPELDVCATRSSQSTRSLQRRLRGLGLLGGGRTTRRLGLGSPRRWAVGAPRLGKPAGLPRFLDLSGPQPAGPQPAGPCAGALPQEIRPHTPAQESCGARGGQLRGAAPAVGRAGPQRDWAQAGGDRPGPLRIPGVLLRGEEERLEATSARAAPPREASAASAPAGDGGATLADSGGGSDGHAQRLWPKGTAAGAGSGGGDDAWPGRAPGAGVAGRLHVRLTREDVSGHGKLGVDAREVIAGVVRGLRITAVHEGGLLAAWNARRAEGRLGVGDRIIEVNGRTERLASALGKAFAEGEPVDLVAVPLSSGRQAVGALSEAGRAAGVLARPARRAPSDDPGAVAATWPPELGGGGEPPVAGSSSFSGGSASLPLQLPSRPRADSTCPARWHSEPGSGGKPPVAGSLSSSGGSASLPLQLPSRPSADSTCPARWHSEPVRCWRADGDQGSTVCPTASTELSAGPARSKRPPGSVSSSALGQATVQSVRLDREDGLVEEMVQSQDCAAPWAPPSAWARWPWRAR
ncbi:unnamed protein product, partial [Prorocentrum cordatum]